MQPRIQEVGGLEEGSDTRNVVVTPAKSGLTLYPQSARQGWKNPGGYTEVLAKRATLQKYDFIIV